MVLKHGDESYHLTMGSNPYKNHETKITSNPWFHPAWWYIHITPHPILHHHPRNNVTWPQAWSKAQWACCVSPILAAGDQWGKCLVKRPCRIGQLFFLVGRDILKFMAGCWFFLNSNLRVDGKWTATFFFSGNHLSSRKSSGENTPRCCQQNHW